MAAVECGVWCSAASQKRLFVQPRVRSSQCGVSDTLRRQNSFIHWLHNKQLLIDFLCASAGGPLYYRGRDMATAHRGMGISESDWPIFLNHVKATLDKFAVPARERGEALAFVESLKKDIVE